MKTLIYQYWKGNSVPTYAKNSKERFEAYAKQIGSDYICDILPFDPEEEEIFRLWYQILAPVLNKDYHEYDSILLAHMDVYPSSSFLKNIFYEPVELVGMVPEFINSYFTHPQEKEMNFTLQANIEGWAFYLNKKLGRSLSRTETGNILIYNCGVILLTKKAIKKLHEVITIDLIKNYITDIYKLDLLIPTYFSRPGLFLHYIFLKMGIEVTTLNDRWNYQRSDYDLYTNKSLYTPYFLHLRSSHKYKFTKGYIDLIIDRLYKDKLVIGVGREPKKGWINSDKHSQYKNYIKSSEHLFTNINVKEKLPFHNDELSFIFSEHVLEHFPEPVGIFFLKEAYRVLKPGGVIRTVVPSRDFISSLKDDDEYVNYYIDYAKKREATHINFFPGISSLITKRCLSIELMGHYWVPTLEMLIEQHERAGFKVKVCNYFESDHDDLKNLEVNNRMRILESIVVEGTK